MKYLKLFENKKIIQQPFFIRNDMLLISDDFAFYLKENVKKSYLYKENEKFFSDLKSSYKYRKFKKNHAYIDLSIKYDKLRNYNKVWNNLGHYKMSIFLKRYKNDEEHLINNSGKFRYYISGNSGDYNMHQKGMIIATRNVNYNFICKYFPIFGFIKDSYRKLKDGDLFFEIIEKGLISGDYYEELNFHDIQLTYEPKEIYNYSYIHKFFVAKKYNL